MLAGLHPALPVTGHTGQAEALLGGQQHARIGRGGKGMQDLGTGLQLDETGDGHPVTPRRRQARHRNGIDPAVTGQGMELVGGLDLVRTSQLVTGLEAELAGIVAMTLTGTHPAFGRDDDGDRLFHLTGLDGGLLGSLDERAAVVAVGLDVGLDLLDDGLLQRGLAAQQALQLLALVKELLQLLLDTDGLQACQLAQADLQDVLGLALGQPEGLHQRGLGLIRFTNDADDLVDVEQHQLPALKDMDAVLDLAQAVGAAPANGMQPEVDPFLQDLGERLLAWPLVLAQHHQVDGHRGFQTGAGQQRVDQQRLLDAGGLGLEDQAHGSLTAAFVTHRIHHVQDLRLGLQLLRCEGLLAAAHLRIAQLLDLFQHLLGRDAMWKLVDNQLPLAPGQFLDVIAGTHADGAPAAAIGLGQVRTAADDLAAAREVGAGHDLHQRLVRQLRVADESDGGLGHFHQVVRRDLGGHGHGNARGAVEQDHRQPRRQQLRLGGRAVVVGHELHRTLVDLVKQQAGVLCEPCLGVTHGSRTVPIARTEVALAIDQRVAQAEVLRHAHHRIVGGGIPMRVIFAQHVTHHPGRLDRLGGRPQPHLVHGKQDAPLHGFLAIAHIRQRSASDGGDGVVQIGPLGVAGQCQPVGALFLVKDDLGIHSVSIRRPAAAGPLNSVRRRHVPDRRALPASCAGRRPRPCPSGA